MYFFKFPNANFFLSLVFVCLFVFVLKESHHDWPHRTRDHRCQGYESISLCLACVYNLAASRENMQPTQDYDNSPQSLCHQTEKGFTNVSLTICYFYTFFKWHQGWEWSSLVECSWSWIWSLDRENRKEKKCKWSKIGVCVCVSINWEWDTLKTCLGGSGVQ